MTDKRYRNWCFTSFVDELKPDLDSVSFITYQKEKCPSTLKTHFQGYVEFAEKKSMAAVKKILNDEKAHLETRKGSQKQAIEYCNKLDTRVGEPFTYGRVKQQGHRKDLDDIFDDIQEGMTQREILMRHGGNAMRHIRCIRDTLYVFWNEDMLDMRIRELRKLGLPTDPEKDAPEDVPDVANKKSINSE